MLSTFFIAFIKVGLFFKLDASCSQTARIESREPVFFLILSFIMHDVVVKANRMDVDEGASFDTADSSAFLHPH